MYTIRYFVIILRKKNMEVIPDIIQSISLLSTTDIISIINTQEFINMHMLKITLQYSHTIDK